MHVFVTGATGWVGSQIVRDLSARGDHVAGLARSAAKAAAAADAGATIVEGSLDDRKRLRDLAAAADAVIHTAFNHDWAHYAESANQDAAAIRAMDEALVGTDKPMLVTSGLGLPAGETRSADRNSTGLNS